MTTPHINHDDLHRRLVALGEAFPAQPGFADALVQRVQAESIAPVSIRSIPLRSWLIKASLGLAATVAITAGLWSLVWSGRALAIDQLPNRLLALHSLHLRGTVRWGSKSYPLEIYVRQPDCFAVDGQTANSNGVINTFDMICFGNQMMVVNHATKTVYQAAVNEQDARMQTAQILQTEMHLMFGPRIGSDPFHKIRAEPVNGVPADVYQTNSAGEPVTVWIDRRTQLPVRTEIGSNSPDGHDVRFDQIDTDPPLPDAVFHPAPPPGFTLATTRPAATQPAVASLGDSGAFSDAAGHTFNISLRYMVDLGRGDVLVCWCLYDPASPAHDLQLPAGKIQVTFTNASGAPYTQRLLHADPTPGKWSWRWSLLRPTAPASTPRVNVKISTGWLGSTGYFSETPVTFDPSDLPIQIQTLQKQTLPRGAAPMTLPQIRQATAP